MDVFAKSSIGSFGILVGLEDALIDLENFEVVMEPLHYFVLCVLNILFLGHQLRRIRVYDLSLLCDLLLGDMMFLVEKTNLLGVDINVFRLLQVTDSFMQGHVRLSCESLIANHGSNLLVGKGILNGAADRPSSDDDTVLLLEEVIYKLTELVVTNLDLGCD